MTEVVTKHANSKGGMFSFVTGAPSLTVLDLASGPGEPAATIAKVEWAVCGGNPHFAALASNADKHPVRPPGSDLRKFGSARPPDLVH